MHFLMLLDIDPEGITQLIQAITYHLEARVDACNLPSAALLGIDERALRGLLTRHGLTRRECDLVILDLQGHSRTEIATACELSASSIKKYWTAINAKLRVSNRMMLRQWVVTRYHTAITANAADLAHESPPDHPPDRPPPGDRRPEVLLVYSEQITANAE